MLKVKVYNLQGEELEEMKLNSKIFGVEINPTLVQQVVEAQLANKRLPLAHTKTRAEVSGGGKKPWRQKGTGRARHGSSRSPIWSGGGVTFGPRKDRTFSLKINKKMKTKALFMSLTDKIKENGFVVVDKLEIPQIKTKDFTAILKKLPSKSISSILVVLANKDEMINKSARNLQKVKTILADSLNVFDVLKFNYLLIDKAGIKKIEETYKS
jgi:large subunit ribosomal protein L4